MPVHVSPSIIRQAIGIIAFLVLVPYLALQVRKPTRWVGRLFLSGMNSSHSDLTDWGLTQVRIAKHSVILDVGCGGGRTIQKAKDVSAGSTTRSEARRCPGRVTGTKTVA